MAFFSAVLRRAVAAVRQYFRRVLTAEALLNVENVPPFIRRHLTKLYFTLLCASASSALGFYLAGNIGSSFAVIGIVACLVWFYFIAPWKTKPRVFLLILGAFFGGVSIAPWFARFLGADFGFVVTSILATSVGFGCFWASSKWTKRFDLLYYKAILLCIPLVLACLLIASYVLGGDIAHVKYQLYALLLWFMAYVAAYSQEVVLKARRGDVDYVDHAISLFIDFPSFVIHLIKLQRAIRGAIESR